MTKTNQKNLERALKALANNRRLQIIRELLPLHKMTVSSLSERIRLSFRSTSKHLQILEKADLVSREQEGLKIYYFIAKDLSNWQKKLLEILS